MSTTTNTRDDHHQELQELKNQVSLLQEKDRQNVTQITTLKRQLEHYQGLSELEQVNYHALFENMPVAIFRTDAKTGKIKYANPMLWKILDCDAQQAVSSLSFYANPEDRANLLQDLMEHKKVVDREIKIKSAKGETTWVTISANYYFENDIIEGVIMDTSAIKDRLVELQRVNYELDNFVYHASHDLRAPLRSIVGLINLMRMEKTASGQQHCLEMIEGSIKRLDKLVIDLLQISRDGRDQISPEPISLVTEINNSITNFYHSEESENIRIITKISQPMDFVSDLTRIRIVLNNLISNAFKYSNRKSGQSYILVEASITGKQAEISVEDNGQGISESRLSHIFDMFVRATDQGSGSGLGLYIVRKVVDKMGGKLSVQSKENSGSRFTFNIPNLGS